MKVNKKELVASLTEFKRNKISAEIMADTIISAIENTYPSLPQGLEDAAKKFIYANYPKIAEAVDNGMDMRLEDEEVYIIMGDFLRAYQYVRNDKDNWIEGNEPAAPTF